LPEKGNDASAEAELFEIFGVVGGYGSPHEKGIDEGERLAQKRDRNEVTNSRSESKKKEQ
jgi:hypothetical protein